MPYSRREYNTASDLSSEKLRQSCLAIKDKILTLNGRQEGSSEGSVHKVGAEGPLNLKLILGTPRWTYK